MCQRFGGRDDSKCRGTIVVCALTMSESSKMRAASGVAHDQRARAGGRDMREFLFAQS